MRFAGEAISTNESDCFPLANGLANGQPFNNPLENW